MTRVHVVLEKNTSNAVVNNDENKRKVKQYKALCYFYAISKNCKKLQLNNFR